MVYRCICTEHSLYRGICAEHIFKDVFVLSIGSGSEACEDGGELRCLMKKVKDWHLSGCQRHICRRCICAVEWQGRTDGIRPVVFKVQAVEQV